MNPKKGQPSPLGATSYAKGVNFCLRAPKAEKARIAIYELDQHTPLCEFSLDPSQHKTDGIWHMAIEELPPSFDYSWFLEGAQKTPQDIPFDPKRPLLDPFAHGINTPGVWGQAQPSALRARYYPPEPFDWHGGVRPMIPYEKLIIYEMHVRGFTIDSSSQTQHPGTYLGIIEKIPYFKELGINAIELMPIYEFNETSYEKEDPLSHKKLCNYWGYSTQQFFCPMKRFAGPEAGPTAVREFKTLVRELHRAGIEVILDVVYNHTAEGHPDPIFSFKGIDNPAYYIVEKDGKDTNYSGTGNTFAGNTPEGQELILDSLRYWAAEMHVDGFRFDLASILTRGVDGAPLELPPLMHAIAHDHVLRSVKLIAEGWDAAGLYQLGRFPAWGHWMEWNGKYRDSVRRFIKGTDHFAGAFAAALYGSQDLYANYPLGPLHSVNFVTCHDGLTLHDLVSYQEKHNQRNGEDNRDGTDQNDSWNCGAEGATEDPTLLKLRQQQMRNCYLALLVSWGVPMILMGDEYAHTHLGNNNTWCQDNELNWFDWNKLRENQGLVRFVQKLIAWRKLHSSFKRKTFLTKNEITWHGQQPFHPDWSEKSRFVAASVHDSCGDDSFYFAFNAGFYHCDCNLPKLKHHLKWHKVVDTSLDSPHDFNENPAHVTALAFTMAPYSAVLFEAK